eukprot:scaffold385_cov305-Pinguiococcus_pyrenoidosus.AAC.12
MYANRDLRHAMYFCFPDWTGGLYATPTIAGSRAGALSAATWASMVRMGEEGYLTRTKDIIETTHSIYNYIDEKIDGLKLLGAPEAMIVCIGTRSLPPPPPSLPERCLWHHGAACFLADSSL